MYKKVPPPLFPYPLYFIYFSSMIESLRASFEDRTSTQEVHMMAVEAENGELREQLH